MTIRRSVLVALVAVPALALALAVALRPREESPSPPSPPASAGLPNEALNGGHPLFADVTAVVVHWKAPDGIARRDLDGDELREAIECLDETRELRERIEETADDRITIVEVVDRYGDRVFDPYSAHLVSGNRGRRYWSPCLASIAARHLEP